MTTQYLVPMLGVDYFLDEPDFKARFVLYNDEGQMIQINECELTEHTINIILEHFGDEIIVVSKRDPENWDEHVIPSDARSLISIIEQQQTYFLKEDKDYTQYYSRIGSLPKKLQEIEGEMYDQFGKPNGDYNNHEAALLTKILNVSDDSIEFITNIRQLKVFSNLSDKNLDTYYHVYIAGMKRLQNSLLE